MCDYLKLSLFQYNSTDLGFELYLNEFSTRQALSYFPPQTRFKITEFGAERFKQNDWISLKNLPGITSIQEFNSYFASEPDLILIDFVASVDAIGHLSTHDDGEATWLFNTQADCITYFEKVIPRSTSKKLVSEVLSNPGLFIEIKEDGSLSKHNSFNDYLRQTTSPTPLP